ncbi:MAG: hypothetical protein ACR2NH_09575 [Solirubrobacteraceae bacterium]
MEETGEPGAGDDGEEAARREDADDATDDAGAQATGGADEEAEQRAVERAREDVGGSNSA